MKKNNKILDLIDEKIKDLKDNPLEEDVNFEVIKVFIDTTDDINYKNPTEKWSDGFFMLFYLNALNNIQNESIKITKKTKLLLTILDYFDISNILDLVNIDDKINYSNHFINSKIKIQDIIDGYNDLVRIYGKKSVDKGLKVLEELQKYRMNNDTEFLKREILNYKLNLTSRRDKRLLDKHFIKDYKAPIVDDAVSTIFNYYNRLLHTDTDKKKAYNNKLYNYERLKKEYIKLFDEKEITNYQDIIKGIDDDLAILILKEIYNHNMKYYDILEQKHKEISSDNNYIISDILTSNGITSFNIDDYKHENLSKLKEKLLLSKDITDNSNIRKILLKKELKEVKVIADLVKERILDKSSIEKNIVLLDTNSLEYNNLINNIEYLKENNKSVINYTSNISNLFIDNNKFIKNIEILDLYDFEKYIKKDKDISFIKEDNLEEKLDMIIELGIEKFIEDEIEFLNLNTFKRLYLAKKVDFNLNEDDIEDILLSDNFYVSLEDIDKYIPDKVEETGNEININPSIIKYSPSNRAMIINGVILSKNRVLRNNKKNLNGYDSLVTGARLNSLELDLIQEKINKDNVI